MAVSNKTYNNVINTLCRLGEYHQQISTVSVGDIYDINLEKMEKFPLLHINPLNVATGDSELVYNFQIFIMDMVSEKNDWKTKQQTQLTKLVNTKNNEQEVWNQTLEIATDFIGMLRHSSRQSLEGINDINAPIYFTQDQFTIEPFQERFDNLCCGWVFQIGVKVMNDFDTCNIPVLNQGAGY
jgi:predicted ATP-dependent protease|tara:strand:- start:935 stop:1483 length:549 start_codon:yes stop_codon:yes gene_type:complete